MLPPSSLATSNGSDDAALPPCTENVVAFQPVRRSAVSIDDLSVSRGQRVVLQEISCAMPAGMITAIVGPSGAGKSTLIGALNGLIPAADGTIIVSGLGRLTAPGVMRKHCRQTATVFQEHALIDRLSALDNVLLGLADNRHPLSLLPWPRALQRRAAEALASVDLLHRAAERVGRLSGGERQRVGLARALVRQPRLLLADEPFASVDPALVQRFAGMLRRLVVERGVTLVIVLHQMETARTLADRIIGLVDGRIRFNGSPREFDATAEFRLFHASPTKREKNGCRNA